MWAKINKKTNLLLLFIVLLAACVRFWLLSSNPPSLTWDEVSWGYNAYTIGLTGQDEYGRFMPLDYLESFGDFKPPVYAYLTVIPVWIFGLTPLAARFPSALFGTLTVLLTYFLVIEIFYTSKQKKMYALTAAFLLAVSPWHILLSRAAFEANVATFFIISGVLLFLFSTREKKNLKYLIFSLLSFVLAMYTFNTSRVFLPIFVPILFILRRKMLFNGWKISIVAVFCALIVSIPLVLFMLTPQAKLRYEEVNIFSDIKVIERVNQEVENDNGSLFSKTIHNRRFAYGVEYLSHYLDNLDPKFLFIKGDGNPKFSIQDVGQMYIWELPFLILGILLVIKKKEGLWGLLPVWLLLGIVPAATARETPHALRIETTLPVFQIFVAYGLVNACIYLKSAFKHMYILKTACAGFVLIVLTFFIYFLHTYFVHYPVKYAQEWQYGYKEAVRFTEENKSKYKKIYFTQDLGRPHAYVLFYGKYSPDTLVTKSNVTREALGFVHVNSIGKYDFSKVAPELTSGILYIDIPSKVPEGVHILKNFKQPNGEIVLQAYEK